MMTIVADAQRKKKKPVKKAPDKFTLLITPQPVNYHFRFFIDREDRLTCGVASSQDGQLAFSDLTDLTSSLLNDSGVFTGERFEHPKFVLAADPAVKLSKIILTLGQLRRVESQVVELEASEDFFLRVVRRPRAESEIVVKPNPLYLLVQLDGDGNITLNREPEGKFPATGKLESRLKEIFKSREENGVFRVGVNEIEKTVRVQVSAPGNDYQTLTKLATAIRDAGSDRIEFDMNGLEPPPPQIPPLPR